MTTPAEQIAVTEEELRAWESRDEIITTPDGLRLIAEIRRLTSDLAHEREQTAALSLALASVQAVLAETEKESVRRGERVEAMEGALRACEASIRRMVNRRKLEAPKLTALSFETATDVWEVLADRARAALAHATPPTLSASEAVYGLCGWLNAHREWTNCADSGDMAQIAADFCRANALPDPRHEWHRLLKHPPRAATPPPDPELQRERELAGEIIEHLQPRMRGAAPKPSELCNRCHGTFWLYLPAGNLPGVPCPVCDQPETADSAPAPQPEGPITLPVSFRAYDDERPSLHDADGRNIACVENWAIARQIAAALNAQPAAGGGGEVSQWEPIGTAPKDGTQVLLCRALNADGEAITDSAWGIYVQVAAWWENEDEEEGGEWIVYCSQPSEPRLHFEPSHWMPLPNNPLRGSRNGD